MRTKRKTKESVIVPPTGKPQPGQLPAPLAPHRFTSTNQPSLEAKRRGQVMRSLALASLRERDGAHLDLIRAGLRKVYESGARKPSKLWLDTLTWLRDTIDGRPRTQDEASD